MDGNKKNWYVVYTRPKWEKKAASLFTRRGIENYCPLHSVIRQWSDRKKTVVVPLFTSYVFVYASTSEHWIIKDTDGVLNFVHCLGKPAMVREAEIDAIKDFLASHDKCGIGLINVCVGDNVRVLKGPLYMQEGEVVALKNNMVKVLLPSLGYMLIAEVEKVNLEPVHAPKVEQPVKLIPAYQS